MTQRLKTEHRWVHGNTTGDYVLPLTLDTSITVHYKGSVSYKQVEWVEIAQKNPVPNPIWDAPFRFPKGLNVLGTKPKLRKLRYDGNIESIETIYSTTTQGIAYIGIPVHTKKEYPMERELTARLSGNVVGFWEEAGTYSPYIEALMEEEKGLKLSGILRKFVEKPEEPKTSAGHDVIET